MAFPDFANVVIVGAGIHGLSSAWRLAEIAHEKGKQIDGQIVVLDKNGIGSGASGIACGVIRNNYYQPAMRELMAHSVNVWESDPEAFSYHGVGYLQISCEAMRADVSKIFEEQRDIGYESDFIEGENACTSYMRGFFGDWQAKGITSILHEKRGGYSNNTKALYGLAKKAEDLGVRIITGVEVKGFVSNNSTGAVAAVETDRGNISCDQVIIAAGPWVRDFWAMLDLPEKISIKTEEGELCDNIDMWRFWQLEEGLLSINPDQLLTDDGKMPPVIHVDTDAPLFSDADGSLITDKLWGIYYKPDWHFNGIQGGSAPYKVQTPVSEVQIDPYGPSSPEFVSGPEFAHMWVSALAHCHRRFQDHIKHYNREPSGGIGCFTADSFPVFDSFRENAYVIADSNHGWKMLGVGRLVAEEITGKSQSLLEPFRFSRFEKGQLHPTSNSPFPWS